MSAEYDISFIVLSSVVGLIAIVAIIGLAVKR